MERHLCLIILGSFCVAFTIAATSAYRYQANKAKVYWRSNEIIKESTAVASNNTSTMSYPTDLCLKPGCIKAAAEILSNIDESTDPCDNFYQFACGGWLNRHPIPRNKGSVSFFEISQHNLNLQLKELLEKKLNGSEPPFVSMLKNVYEACMNIESIEKANAQPLKRVLKALGGWPVVEGIKWNENNFDWIETLKSLRRMGYGHNMLLNLRIGVNQKNVSIHTIIIDQAELGMPDRTYLIHGLNDSSTKAYFNLMLNAAKRLGAEETAAEEELMKSLNFEIALANFSLPREAYRSSNYVYYKYTVGKLQKDVPQVPWLKYLNALLSEEIFDDETLRVLDINFVIKFANLISRTEKRVIANYILWQVVFQSLRTLSAEWRYLLQEYTTALKGTNQESPRWEECLSSLTADLSTALSSYYVRNYFQEENKEAGVKLYNYLQEEFLKNLKEIKWMEEETKLKAKEKVEAIKSYIGYPDELLNDTLVQRLYSNLKVTNDSFFDNTLKIRKWITDSQFSVLRKPFVKRHWTQHSVAIVVNSFYKTIENTIEFLAGIFQDGFFDKNRPQYMNFGAIGFVLSHELTHSLDDIGSHYDKDGNLNKWWDRKTEEKFKEKAQCIVDQFSNFTAKIGMKLNGVNTEGENIADNGGFKLAYKAYQSWIRDNGPEKKLPGLKYTPSQLFWISTTNIWCGKFRPEALKLRILTGTHTPDNFRIIGGLSNLAEFSQEFNCPPDAKMNPKRKCAIW